MTIHRYPSATVENGVSRFCSYLESFSRGTEQTHLGMYPGLSDQAFHDARTFAVARDLERAHVEIRNELLGIADVAFHPEQEKVDRTGSWEVLYLFERGRTNVENCRLCPSTAKLLKAHSIVRTLAGLAYVSKMRPGTHVAAHCGPTNIRLRCHLGVQVPEGDCGIRVGQQRQKWQEGKCLVFNDSLEHESWNHTAETRIVLIVDLWHSDLAAEEIGLLEGLHNYASAQAENLAHYWIWNAKARTARRVSYD